MVCETFNEKMPLIRAVTAAVWEMRQSSLRSKVPVKPRLVPGGESRLGLEEVLPDGRGRPG
jgi:hypothetical protein